MLMAVNPPSLLGGFLIVALFITVFCAVYITRVITVILTAKLNKPSNQNNFKSSGQVFSVRERKTPAAPRKRVSPALKSAVKKPVGKVYFIETDD